MATHPACRTPATEVAAYGIRDFRTARVIQAEEHWDIDWRLRHWGVRPEDTILKGVGKGCRVLLGVILSTGDQVVEGEPSLGLLERRACEGGRKLPRT